MYDWKKSRVYWELERDGKTTSYSLQIAGSCVIFLNQPSIDEYSPIPAPHVLYPENVDKIHDYSAGLLVSYSCGQVFFTLCLSGRVMCAISLGPLLSVVLPAWTSSLVLITTLIAEKMVAGEREREKTIA